MRIPTRVLGLVGIAALAITCTDAPTGPGGSRAGLAVGRVGIVPRFSAEAASTYRTLAMFGLDVTKVRITLLGADGRVAKDTVVVFPADQDVLTVELPVQITGTEQTFTAGLLLLDDRNVPLFSGSQQVVARATALPAAAPPPAVVIVYVGPGVSVKTVTMTPPSASVPASDRISLTARGFDQAGAEVTNTPFVFTASDATIATIAQNGTGVADVRGTGRRGTVTITAVTPTGISATSQITFVPVPTTMSQVSGGTVADAGKPAPTAFTVEVRAADNLPVSGVPVTFAATTAGASITPASAVTDAAGQASARITPGHRGGVYLFTASAPGLTPVSLSVTVKPPPPAAVAASSGASQSLGAGRSAEPLVVKVTDEFGEGVEGATVAWSVASGSGRLASATTTTDASGSSSNGYQAGTAKGRESVRAGVAGVTGAATFELTVQPLAPATATVVSGDRQEGRAGATLANPLVVRITDTFGNAVGAAAVTWSATGGAVVSPLAPATGDDGNASANVTLPRAVGPSTITATAGAATVTFTATTTAATPATMAKHAGDAQTALARSAVPVAPAVRLTDAAGGAVAGVAVRFAVASGGGTITANGAAASASASVVTSLDGVAAVDAWTLGADAGANTLTASLGALATTFTATGASRARASMIFVQAPPTAITVGASIASTVKVQLVDGLGGVVREAGVEIVATGTSVPASAVAYTATATSGADGIATFALPPYLGSAGTLTLAFSSTGIPSLSSGPIAAGAGAPARLVITANAPFTAASGAVLAPAIVVRVSDAGGNLLSAAGVEIGASLASGAGSLGGTRTVSTDAGGSARFDAMTITGASGAYTIRFAAGSLATATTTPVTLGAGAAAAMTAVEGDRQTAAVRSVMPVQPKVKVTDAAGNAVSGVEVRFTPSGGSTVRGASAPDAVTTDAAGLAAARAWTLGPVAGTQSLVVSSGSLAGSPLTFTATATPSVARGLAVATQPSPAAVNGSPFGRQPAVQLTDADGNAVPLAGVVVTAALASGDGNLLGGTQATSDGAGRAVFASLAVTGAPGKYTLGFTSAGLAPAGSAEVTLEAAAGGRLTFAGGAPTQAVVPLDTIGAPLQLVVEARDAANTLLRGVPVSIAPLAGVNGTVGVSSAVTDASGRVAIAWMLGDRVKTDSVVIRSSGMDSLIARARAAAGRVASLETISSQPSFTVGAPFSVAVAAYDRAANRVTSSAQTASLRIKTGTGRSGAVLGGTLEQAMSDAQYLFGNLSIDRSGTGFVLLARMADAQGVLVEFPAVTVRPLFTVVTQPSATAVSGVALATQPRLRFADANGSLATWVTGTVTATVPGHTVAGNTASIVEGEAAFANLAISGSPGPVVIQFGASGNSSVSSISSSGVTLSSGGPGIAVESGARTVMSPSGLLTGGVTRFRVTSGGIPVGAGVSVSVSAAPSVVCTTDYGTLVTDASGEIGVPLHSTARGGGCTVTASPTGAEVAARAQVAVVPSGFTHVWFGGTAAESFDAPGNWLSSEGAVTSAPSAATDHVYIPRWLGAVVSPTVHGERTIGRLFVDSVATLDLDAHSLRTNGDVVARSASVYDGTLVAGGHDVTVSGTIHELELGVSGSCSGSTGHRALVHSVFTNSLRINCTAVVDTAVTSRLTSGAGSHILVRSSGLLYASSDASLTGDSVFVRGVLGVAGTLSLSTPRTLLEAGSFLYGGGDASFGGALTAYSGSQMQIVGNAIFTATGSSAADNITVVGNAAFSGAGFSLTRGQLVLYGDLDESGPTASFLARGDHLTRFIGNVNQHVVLANRATFARVRNENTVGVVSMRRAAAGAPVAFEAGADSLRLELREYSAMELTTGATVPGNVHVRSHAALTARDAFIVSSPAVLRLFRSSTFNAGAGSTTGFTGRCSVPSGDAPLNIVATGSFNGQLTNPLSSCFTESFSQEQ